MLDSKLSVIQKDFLQLDLFTHRDNLMFGYLNQVPQNPYSSMSPVMVVSTRCLSSLNSQYSKSYTSIFMLPMGKFTSAKQPFNIPYRVVKPTSRAISTVSRVITLYRPAQKLHLISNQKFWRRQGPDLARVCHTVSY